MQDNISKTSEPRFADTATLARRYSVSSRQIQKWRTAGILPAVNLGRRCLRFDIISCDTALECFTVRAAATCRKARAALADEGRA